MKKILLLIENPTIRHDITTLCESIDELSIIFDISVICDMNGVIYYDYPIDSALVNYLHQYCNNLFLVVNRDDELRKNRPLGGTNTLPDGLEWIIYPYDDYDLQLYHSALHSTRFSGTIHGSHV